MTRSARGENALTFAAGFVSKWRFCVWSWKMETNKPFVSDVHINTHKTVQQNPSLNPFRTNNRIVSPVASPASLCLKLQFGSKCLILFNPTTSARVVRCAIYSAVRLKVLFSKPPWLPSGRSWNKVTGLIAAAARSEVSEPWEKSAEVWPPQQQHDTQLHWDPRASAGYRGWVGGWRGLQHLFSLYDPNSYACLLASTQGFTQTLSIFHWGAPLVPFYDLLLEAL